MTTSSLLIFSFVFMFAGANADLRGQLSGAQAALRAKEAEYNALVLERDRLAKKLADQEESHKAALKKAQDSEDALKAEFETEAAGWAEAKQALSEYAAREGIRVFPEVDFLNFYESGAYSVNSDAIQAATHDPACKSPQLLENPYLYLPFDW